MMRPRRGCSAIALAVLLDRAWYWWRGARGGDAEPVLDRAARGDWDEAARLAERSRSPVARRRGLPVNLPQVASGRDAVADGDGAS